MTSPVPVPPPPLPPPVPPPPPTSGPTPTVEVRLPDDLVNKLAPQHSWTDWFYVSGATLIAAFVAIIAAIVAYKAVTRQISSSAAGLQEQLDANAKNVQDQIDANQKNVDAQIEANQKALADQLAAEAKHRKRAERLNFVTEATAIVHELFDSSGTNRRLGTFREQQEVQQAYHALEVRAYITASKLTLIGMTAEATLMTEYMYQVAAADRSGSGGDDLMAKYAETLKALKNAVDD